jgi:hypothetical protein
MNFTNEKKNYKNKQNKKNKKRIRGVWEKDDYGFVYKMTCDFCGNTADKLKLKLSQFTTNCEYNGIRKDYQIFIVICNKCTKKNPKQIFKLN